MKPITVLIVEDQEIVRSSLEIVLGASKSINVAGAAKNGIEAVKLVHELKPDVVLMDIRMPKMDGVKCTEIIKAKYPNVKIIILTTFDDDDYVINALKNGANGYLLKGMSIEELEKSIITVYEGGAIINSDVTAKVINMFSRMANTDYVRLNPDEVVTDMLNNTETKIVKMVGTGLSNKEIAHELCLSEGTIRNYISSILSKLGLSNRTQIAIYAMQTGLVMKK